MHGWWVNFPVISAESLSHVMQFKLSKKKKNVKIVLNSLKAKKKFNWEEIQG